MTIRSHPPHRAAAPKAPAPAPTRDHNHAHIHVHDHLHSHAGVSRHDQDEDAHALMKAFIAGFRAADDKTSFLRLSGVPHTIEDSRGRPMHLVEARIEQTHQLGTASPGFGTGELTYLPYPGAMVRAREGMTFTYVSMAERRDLPLHEVLLKSDES
ncbi:MAG: hypothetical protein AAGB11_10390 [Pseudomonadota bacterium]